MLQNTFFVFPVNDTLDDMLTESGDEEESDNIVSQVLDEIGIEMSGKVIRFYRYTKVHFLKKTFAFLRCPELLFRKQEKLAKSPKVFQMMISRRNWQN